MYLCLTEYLKTREWRVKRNRALIRAGNRCQVCAPVPKTIHPLNAPSHAPSGRQVNHFMHHLHPALFACLGFARYFVLASMRSNRIFQAPGKERSLTLEHVPSLGISETRRL